MSGDLTCVDGQVSIHFVQTEFLSFKPLETSESLKEVEPFSLTVSFTVFPVTWWTYIWRRPLGKKVLNR